MKLYNWVLLYDMSISYAFGTGVYLYRWRCFYFVEIKELEYCFFMDDLGEFRIERRN